MAKKDNFKEVLAKARENPEFIEEVDRFIKASLTIRRL
jgi:hypothetical protein